MASQRLLKGDGNDAFAVPLGGMLPVRDSRSSRIPRWSLGSSTGRGHVSTTSR